jgi:hypothetical protein
LLVKRARNQRKKIINTIILAQRLFRRYKATKLLRKRIAAKKLILSLFKGWKIRRVINALSKEIQDYVNCEDPYQRLRLKSQFLVLYESVMANSLWVSKNFYRLQRMQSLQTN